GFIGLSIHHQEELRNSYMKLANRLSWWSTPISPGGYCGRRWQRRGQLPGVHLPSLPQLPPTDY
ncbi:MAG: hypothetical protein ACUVSZ_13695, partial [Chloroflexus sp.]